jgi:molybdopterin synthase catalytic subunit
MLQFEVLVGEEDRVKEIVFFWKQESQRKRSFSVERREERECQSQI